MRLIEVNVLKEWIENWFTKNRLYHPYAKNNNIPITELYDILEQMPSAQPEQDEWCTDCKEYDPKKHCCPRFNRVIRNALKDAQPERKKGKWAEEFDRTIRELGVNCAYDMPSFWRNQGKDYKVIPTKYHKGYMQALADVEERMKGAEE